MTSEIQRVVLRVTLPDRPGALGAVASRVGSIGADIAGIEVLEHEGGTAVDEFSVVLPRAGLASLLVREVEEVDGVVVQQYRVVDEFSDSADAALALAAALVSTTTREELARILAAGVRRAFCADLVEVRNGTELLASFGEHAAGELATHAVGAFEITVGRNDDPLRARERSELTTLLVIAASLHARMGMAAAG